MGQIFISYRRQDSAYIANHLNHRLQDEFGAESIFFDIDAIPFGVDFREHIGNAIGSCNILLVVIGNQWLGAKDEKGGLRLENEADYVRIEIEAALKRNIPIIPVLVDDAGMPREGELPETIQPLAFRNAIEIRAGRDQSQHVERLVVGLQGFFNELEGHEKKVEEVRPAPQKEKPAEKAPPQKPAAEAGPDPLECIKNSLQDFHDSYLFVAPHIPHDKARNAINTYAMGVPVEDVLLLFDNTLFRSAKDGILMTQDTVYWRSNGPGTGGHVRYENIRTIDHQTGIFSRRITLNGVRMELNMGDVDVAMYIAHAIRALRGK